MKETLNRRIEKLQALPGAACKRIVVKWRCAAGKQRSGLQEDTLVKKGLEVSQTDSETCLTEQQTVLQRSGEGPQQGAPLFDGHLGDSPRVVGTLSKSNNDSAGCDAQISLRHGSSLATILKDAVLDYRQRTATERKTNQRLAELDQDLSDLRRNLCQLEYNIAVIEDTGPEQARSKLPRMRHRAQDIRAQQAVIESEQEQLHQHMEEFHELQSSQQEQLFATLDELLVATEILSPEEPEAEQPYVQDAENVKPKCHDISESEAQNETASAATESGKRSDGSVQRMLGVEDVPPVQAAPVGATVEGKAASSDARFDILYELRSKRTMMHCAEEAFDNRGEQFDREADERDRKLEQGEEAEPLDVFDMRQLKETQQLTRDLIAAEMAYEAAKTAAVAKGVQPDGSDVESGFVDNVDDGYRISSEEDMITAAQHGIIEWWLEGVPEPRPCPDDAIASEDSLRSTVGPNEEVEVDDWDARSVEICDSSSMMAEDRWRKRIDKWRAACGHGQAAY